MKGCELLLIGDIKKKVANQEIAQLIQRNVFSSFYETQIKSEMHSLLNYLSGRNPAPGFKIHLFNDITSDVGTTIVFRFLPFDGNVVGTYFLCHQRSARSSRSVCKSK